MSKSRDIYQEWKDTGKLKEVIEFIVECSTKMVSQQEMARQAYIQENYGSVDEWLSIQIEATIETLKSK